MIKVLKMLALISGVILLSHCGLPSITSVQLAPNRPEVSGYSDGETLVIEIDGYYPVEQFPDFNGFNIYFGSNNTQTDIFKRILYINDQLELPSYFTSDLVGVLDPPITLTNNFTFRLTTSSDEQDLADEQVFDINQEILRTIAPHDRFYFIVRPVNDYTEYNRSETLRIYVPDVRERPVPLLTGESTTLLSTPNESQFNDESVFPVTIQRLTSDEFTILPANNATIRIKVTSPQNIENGCYQSFDITTQRDSFFADTSFPLAEQLTYVFISDRDNAESYQYRIYVKEIRGDIVDLCTAYERS